MKDATETPIYPILPLKNVVVFPQIVQHLGLPVAKTALPPFG